MEQSEWTGYVTKPSTTALDGPVIRYGRVTPEEIAAYPRMEVAELTTRPDPLLLVSLVIGALNLIGVGVLLVRG